MPLATDVTTDCNKHCPLPLMIVVVTTSSRVMDGVRRGWQDYCTSEQRALLSWMGEQFYTQSRLRQAPRSCTSKQRSKGWKLVSAAGVASRAAHCSCCDALARTLGNGAEGKRGGDIQRLRAEIKIGRGRGRGAQRRLVLGLLSTLPGLQAQRRRRIASAPLPPQACKQKGKGSI